MINNHFPTITGTLVILAVLAGPAIAAEGVEAKLEVCSTCHGQDGKPINTTTPIIWGQQEYFLVKQMHDYKSGDRENQVMSTMAQTLTQADLRPAARYFAAKTWPARSAPATPAPQPD